MSFRLRITHRFAALAMLAIAMVGGAVVLSLVQIRSAMLDQKRLEIRHNVEAAATIAQGFLARTKTGEFTETEARRRTSDALRSARFDG